MGDVEFESRVITRLLSYVCLWSRDFRQSKTQMLRAFSAIANDGQMLAEVYYAICDKKSDTARKSKRSVGKPVS